MCELEVRVTSDTETVGVVRRGETGCAVYLRSLRVLSDLWAVAWHIISLSCDLQLRPETTSISML